MKSLLMALGVCLLTQPVYAGKVETPKSIDGGTLVTAAEAHKLQKSGATIIDARKRSDFAKLHIKGAVRVEYKENKKTSAKSKDYDGSKDKFDVSKLGSDKSKKLVIYCNGPTCWRSYKASVSAIKAGYKNINWLRGGIADWTKAKLPTE